MYKIIKTDGTDVGTVEAPMYIKVSASGCFTPCKADEAQGVAVNSVAYNLFGKDGVGAEETVLLREVDGGAELDTQGAQVEQLQADALAADETAVELYEACEALEAENLEQAETLVELYELIGG